MYCNFYWFKKELFDINWYLRYANNTIIIQNKDIKSLHEIILDK